MNSAKDWPGRRVLLVDDNADDLDLLRMALLRSGVDWQLAFASGAREALTLFGERRFDVVVSDMRMPGMSGTELLAEIRKISPRTVRIIISGHFELSSILKAVGPIHQFAPKPCDVELLRKRIDRAFSLRDAVWDPAMLDLIGGLPAIPSLPNLYEQVIWAINEGCTEREIGALVAQDVGMTAKVLQVVNSTPFRTSCEEIQDPTLATALLGKETLHSVILGAKLFEEFSVEDRPSVEEVWRESLRAAMFARKICAAERAGPVVTNQAILASFMQNVGMLAVAAENPDLFSTVWRSRDVDAEAAERARLGASHAKIGGCLLSLWGLPDPIVEAVAFHHHPQEAGVLEFGPLAIVHIAQGFAHTLPTSAEPSALRRSGIDTDYLTAAGLLDRIPGWLEACRIQDAA